MEGPNRRGGDGGVGRRARRRRDVGLRRQLRRHPPLSTAGGTWRAAGGWLTGGTRIAAVILC